jgi:hypothetical protein
MDYGPHFWPDTVNAAMELHFLGGFSGPLLNIAQEVYQDDVLLAAIHEGDSTAFDDHLVRSLHPRADVPAGASGESAMIGPLADQLQFLHGFLHCIHFFFLSIHDDQVL